MRPAGCYTDDVTLTVDVGFDDDNYVVAPVLTGGPRRRGVRLQRPLFYLDNSDLEIVREGSTEQAVGLRFADLPIPAGAQVSEAYVQFTVDEPEMSTEDFAVDIRVEDVDDAAPFTTETANLTSRTFSEQSVRWAASAVDGRPRGRPRPAHPGPQRPAAADRRPRRLGHGQRHGLPDHR